MGEVGETGVEYARLGERGGRGGGVPERARPSPSRPAERWREEMDGEEGRTTMGAGGAARREGTERGAPALLDGRAAEGVAKRCCIDGGSELSSAGLAARTGRAPRTGLLLPMAGLGGKSMPPPSPSPPSPATSTESTMPSSLPSENRLEPDDERWSAGAGGGGKPEMAEGENPASSPPCVCGKCSGRASSPSPPASTATNSRTLSGPWSSRGVGVLGRPAAPSGAGQSDGRREVDGKKEVSEGRREAERACECALDERREEEGGDAGRGECAGDGSNELNGGAFMS